MMSDPELKQYLELLFSNLKDEFKTFREQIQTLTNAISQQGATIRQIEINATQKIAQLEGDLNRAFDHIRNVETEIAHQEDTRVASDISLGKRQTDFETEQNKKWADYNIERTEQIKINNSIKNLTMVLWAIFVVVLGILIGFVWEMIKSGGIKGMIQ